MPFYLYKPVNTPAFAITDCVIVIPTTVQIFDCGHCFFTVFINRFLVECHIAVVAAGFLWVICITADVSQNLSLSRAAGVVNVSNCVTHFASSFHP